MQSNCVISEEDAVMKKRVGYWMSAKKVDRLNFKNFVELCRNSGIELVLIDLDVDLETQGPFDAILHKASDLIIFGDQGDLESARRVRNISKFQREHSCCVIVDPLPSVRLLCDRYLQYSLLRAVAHEDQVLTPAFTDLTSEDIEENKHRLRKSGVRFPVICKPLVAHGSSLAHMMALVFCEKKLSEVEMPCVAQSFIPHDAVLYKVFVLGDKHFIISRPSVRNLIAGDFPTIFFDSHKVSKDGCTSELSKVEEDVETSYPSEKKIEAAIRSIVTCTNLSLFGVDIIVESGTDRLYAIDVNAFPSYDGVPDFFQHLLHHLRQRLKLQDAEFAVSSSDQSKAPSNCFPPRRDSTSLTEKLNDDWFLTRGLSSTIHGSARFPGIAKLLQEEKRRRTERMAEIVETGGSAQGSPKHARSTDEIGCRGRSPNDSGIGSCTESDTSDCEKKLKLWKLEAERNRERSRHVSHAVHAALISHVQAAEVVQQPTESTPESNATPPQTAEKKQMEFFPDWKRIKKFYGIPKPTNLDEGGADEAETSSVTSEIDLTGDGKEAVVGRGSLGDESLNLQSVTKLVSSESVEELSKPRAGTIP